jgi:hypothetical protein
MQLILMGMPVTALQRAQRSKPQRDEKLVLVSQNGARFLRSQSKLDFYEANLVAEGINSALAPLPGCGSY